jgi:hypothetical protein
MRIALGLVCFTVAGAAQETLIMPQQPSLALSLLVNAGEEEQQIQITDPVDVSEIQSMLTGLPQTGQPAWPDLGFRGLQLVNRGISGFPDAVRVFEGVIRVSQSSSETFYFDTKGLESKLTAKATPIFVGLAKQALKSSFAHLPENSELVIVLDPLPKEPPNPTNGSEPKYEPDKWNVVNVRTTNNCYTYATNNLGSGFTRPGKGGGKEAPKPGDADYNKEKFKAALLADGLTEIECGKPCPKDSYKIAFVLRLMGRDDFHCYRQDSGGNWSHKPGETDATDKDNSGKTISDIEKADRGAYTVFVGCFCVDPKKVKVK